MEITSLLTGLVPGRKGAGETSQGERRSASTTPSKHDRVSVSAEAKRRAAAAYAAPEEPVRREKVEEIKALIQSGSYEINVGKIAKKIVQEDPEVFSTTLARS